MSKRYWSIETKDGKPARIVERDGPATRIIATLPGDSDKVRVAQLHHWHHARLIASAPDMATLLRELVDALTKDGPKPLGPGMMEVVRKAYRVLSRLS